MRSFSFNHKFTIYERLMFNYKIRIKRTTNNNIKIIKHDDGSYEAEIKDLDLSFLKGE